VAAAGDADAGATVKVDDHREFGARLGLGRQFLEAGAGEVGPVSFGLLPGPFIGGREIEAEVSNHVSGDPHVGPLECRRHGTRRHTSRQGRGHDGPRQQPSEA